MQRKDLLLALGLAVGTTGAHAALIDFQMSEAGGTDMTGLVDSGTAGVSIAGATANVTTNGSGELVFTQGVDASDNVFRNTGPDLDINTGVYSMEFVISEATIAGGDNAGANVGFGLRDNVTNTTLFVIRLQRQSQELRLQTRIGTTNTDLHDFNATSLSGPLTVNATIDLDNDTMDISWSGAAVGQSLGVAIEDGDFDALRIQGNTNTGDWGATDFVNVDYVTVSEVPEPGSLALLGLGGLLIARRRRA